MLPAPLGEPFELIIGFPDPGAADLHDVTVDWGDGSPEPLAGVAGTTAAFSHTYAAAGAFAGDGDRRRRRRGPATDGFTATVVPFCGGFPVTIDAGALGAANRRWAPAAPM